MKKVLITGASGFIGQPLAHHLLDEGYEVTVFAERPIDAVGLAQRGATVIREDLAISPTLEEAMEGVDCVFHLTTMYELGGDIADMRRVHVEGTRNVLDAAQKTGVARIVYGGSDAALGNTGGQICDESKTHDGDFRSVYERTRHEAHNLVERRIDAGAPIVHAIVSTVYGPGDESLMGRLIAHHVAGRLPAHLDGNTGYTFTHVDDVVTGLRLAYERGTPGQSYILGDTPATLDHFFSTLSEHTCVPAPYGQLPGPLVDLLAPVAEKMGPAFKMTEREIRELVSIGRDVTRYYSGQKAQEELGWEPRSLTAGLRDTIPWFQSQERQAADRLLQSTQIPLVGMSIFDIGLGLSALVFPQLYSQLLHPHSGPQHLPATRSLLARTGLIWLVFAVVQGGAALDPKKHPEWVMIAGALRLMDIPADIGYFLSSKDQGLLGKAGLLVAPVFNLGIGAFLTYAGYRGLRAKFWK